MLSALDRQHSVAPPGFSRWLIPPAALPVPTVLTGIAAVSGLGGLAAAASGAVAPMWRVSALAGPDLDADARRVLDFDARFGGRAAIDSIEGKATSADQAIDLVSRFPGRDVFVEVPLEPDPSPLVREIASAGGRAKVRTGGITSDAFPSPHRLLRFLVACRDAGARFKATAGLHHPVRAEHRLTYEPDAPRGTMFGFLNVLLAAGFLHEGVPERDVLHLLEERTPDRIRFDDERAWWREYSLPVDRISRMRFEFATSFGSCSCREPIDELRQLALL